MSKLFSRSSLAAAKSLRPTKLQGIVYAILSAATFGTIPLFSMSAVRADYGTYSITCYRFGFAVLLFGTMILIRRIRLTVSWRQLLELFLLGTCCYGGSAFALIHSYEFIPSGIATTINFLYPVMVALIMRFVFGERIDWRVALAIVFSLIGVALLAWEGGETGMLDPRGVLASLTTVLCYGIYIVGINKLSVRKLPGSVVTFYVLLFTFLAAFVLAQFHGGVHPIDSMRIGGDLVLLALVSSIVSNLTLVLAVQSIGSTFTSVLGSVEPLTAISCGVLFLGETLQLQQAIGAAVVVLSVAIVVAGKGNKPHLPDIPEDLPNVPAAPIKPSKPDETK